MSAKQLELKRGQSYRCIVYQNTRAFIPKNFIQRGSVIQRVMVMSICQTGRCFLRVCWAYNRMDPNLSEPLNIWIVAMTVLLKYFVTSVCSIRVVEWRSENKSMGFIYPNKFTYLNTFVIQLAHRYLDNQGPTVTW